LQLEFALAAQEIKLAKVEKMASKRGVVRMILDYGAPFALWYAIMWAGGWFGIYMLLELNIVSSLDSVRPLLEGLGLESYADKVDPSMGNAVIAFFVNELLEPFRIPLVLVTGRPAIQAATRLFEGLRRQGAGGRAGAAPALPGAEALR